MKTSPEAADMRAADVITAATVDPQTSGKMNTTQAPRHGHPTGMTGRSSALPPIIYRRWMERQGNFAAQSDSVVPPQERPRSMTTIMTTRCRLMQGWIWELEQGFSTRINSECHPTVR